MKPERRKSMLLVTERRRHVLPGNVNVSDAVVNASNAVALGIYCSGVTWALSFYRLFAALLAKINDGGADGAGCIIIALARRI